MTHRFAPNRAAQGSRRAFLAAGAGLLGGCVGGEPTPPGDRTATTANGTPEAHTTGGMATLDATPTTVASTADGVDAYSSFLLSGVDAMRDSLPVIADAADAAAEQYVTTDAPLAVEGDISVAMEAYRRAGGLMPLVNHWQVPEEITGGPAILVLALREDQFLNGSITDGLVRKAVAHSGDPWTVIGLGRSDLLDLAADEGMTFAGRVPTPAAPNEGLFATAGGEHLVPTSPPLTAAGLWAWTAEFVAACTRRGKMPPMYLAFSQEGGTEREKRLGDQRFHDEAPDPIDPQVLGRRYLDALRSIVDRVATAERDAMTAGANTLLAAHGAGNRDWGFYSCHALVRGQAAYPHDPGDPRMVNPRDWFAPTIGAFDIDDLGPQDAILCIGYNSRFAGWDKWVNDEGVPMDERLRTTGADLIWSFASREDKGDVAVLAEHDEPLIDQHWPEGDAVLDVAGYDIPILPASGVTSHQVHRTIQAGMLADLESDVRAVPR